MEFVWKYHVFCGKSRVPPGNEECWVEERSIEGNNEVLNEIEEHKSSPRIVNVYLKGSNPVE